MTMPATHSLIKTRPEADKFTGAVIRAALERHGVAHRVGGGAVERGWLATTGTPFHNGPTVYVTANSMSYDVPATGFLGFFAVTTDEHSTRSVYAPDADNLHPDAAREAERCAAAVAVYLGLSEPERACLDCGRGIEWIGADRQAAWHDSSHGIECADGQSPHTPEPLCGWCEDTGLITLYDASTDGITGHRRCDNPPCTARSARQAAEYERKRAEEEAAAAAHVCADDLCCPPF